MTTGQIELGIMFPIVYTWQLSYDLRLRHGGRRQAGAIEGGWGELGNVLVPGSYASSFFYLFFFLWFYDCKLEVVGEL